MNSKNCISSYTFRSLKDPRNRSAQFFIKHVEYFNSLYYKFLRVDDFEQFQRFQAFLDIYGTGENETYYDILRAVKIVST